MPVSSLARVEIEFCDRVDRHREPEQQTQCEAAECEEAGAGTESKESTPVVAPVDAGHKHPQPVIDKEKEMSGQGETSPKPAKAAART